MAAYSWTSDFCYYCKQQRTLILTGKWAFERLFYWDKSLDKKRLGQREDLESFKFLLPKDPPEKLCLFTFPLAAQEGVFSPHPSVLYKLWHFDLLWKYIFYSSSGYPHIQCTLTLRFWLDTMSSSLLSSPFTSFSEALKYQIIVDWLHDPGMGSKSGFENHYVRAWILAFFPVFAYLTIRENDE